MSILSLPPYRDEAPCPRCESRGQAVSVGAGPDLRMICYACTMCGHEWFTSEEMPRGRVLPFTPRASSPFRSFQP
jgi:hypothetical protein